MAKDSRTRGRRQGRCLLDSHDERVLPSLRAVAAGHEDFLHIPGRVLHYLNLALKRFATIGRRRIVPDFAYRCSWPPPDPFDARLNLPGIDSKESGAIRAVAAAGGL